MKNIILLSALLMISMRSPAAAQTRFWDKEIDLVPTPMSFITLPSGKIFALGNKVLCSPDEGISWTEINNGLNNERVSNMAYSPNGDLFAVGEQNVFRSTNEGEQWNIVYNWPPRSEILSLVIDLSGNIYIGSYNIILYSTDNGITWKTKRFGLRFGSKINSLVLGASGELFAATSLERVFFISRDQARHFRRVALSNSKNYYTSGMWSTRTGEIFLGQFSSFDYNGLAKKVVQLKGTRFQTPIFLRSGGYFCSPGVVAMLSDLAGNLYIGDCGEGVFRSTDHGKNWNQFNDGLPTGSGSLSVYIETLGITKNGFILAAAGDGIYRSHEAYSPSLMQNLSNTIEFTPSVFQLHQNYPNPFNPTTTIEFELASDALVTAKVYNTLGQEVAELIHSELMDEGMQELEFDGSNLPSGVYYYRIDAQDIETGQVQFTSVKKMLMIK